MRSHETTLTTLESFDAISRSVAARLQCDNCLISIVSDRALVSVGQSGRETDWATRAMAAKDTVCAQVVKLDRSLMVRNVATVDWLRNLPAVAKYNIGAYMGVPLKVDEQETVGVICALNTEARLWTAEELTYLKDVAEFVSGRIDRDMLRFERDALSTELNETDRILALLSRSSAPAVTVHDRDGAMLFANAGMRDKVATDKDGIPDLPWDRIARLQADMPNGEIEVMVRLLPRGMSPVRVTYTTEPGGLILCDWWLPA